MKTQANQRRPQAAPGRPSWPARLWAGARWLAPLVVTAGNNTGADGDWPAYQAKLATLSANSVQQ